MPHGAHPLIQPADDPGAAIGPPQGSRSSCVGGYQAAGWQRPAKNAASPCLGAAVHNVINLRAKLTSNCGQVVVARCCVAGHPLRQPRLTDFQVAGKSIIGLLVSLSLLPFSKFLVEPIFYNRHRIIIYKLWPESLYKIIMTRERFITGVRASLKRIDLSGQRESNPSGLLGRQVHYRYAMPAIWVAIQRHRPGECCQPVPWTL